MPKFVVRVLAEDTRAVREHPTAEGRARAYHAGDVIDILPLEIYRKSWDVLPFKLYVVEAASKDDLASLIQDHDRDPGNVLPRRMVRVDIAGLDADPKAALKTSANMATFRELATKADVTAHTTPAALSNKEVADLEADVIARGLG